VLIKEKEVSRIRRVSIGMNCEQDLQDLLDEIFWGGFLTFPYLPSFPSQLFGTVDTVWQMR